MPLGCGGRVEQASGNTLANSLKEEYGGGSSDIE